MHVAAIFHHTHMRRLHEKPQRPWLVWGMDVMKQVLSSLAAHVCGMVIAIVAAHRTAHTSECAWYFVAFTFDTTLGVAITIALHRGVLQALESIHARRPSQAIVAVLECGKYGDPPSLQRWAIQLSEWTTCVVLARAIVGTLVRVPPRQPEAADVYLEVMCKTNRGRMLPPQVVLLSPLLVRVAWLLDTVFAGHPNLLLAFVMVVCPLLMNMAQLLVQDWVLRWRGGRGGSTPGRVVSGDGVWRASLSDTEAESAELLPRR